MTKEEKAKEYCFQKYRSFRIGCDVERLVNGAYVQGACDVQTKALQLGGLLASGDLTISAFQELLENGL